MSYFNLLVSYLVVKLLLVDVNGSGMGHNNGYIIESIIGLKKFEYGYGK